ncbi:NAD(P)-binding protein [Hypoxylon rubiginosum]|uniref:NAD(P)-binding protein n=1 Tax=Hypoxylon rubiginosum TaxID=110542 RepID=A0ACB9ZE03_9PEZI|nr:NAD(P)-binding protein [Hypoxylon rubiginosum]
MMAPASKVALITGGASGIGYAIATMLSAKGWLVSIVDIDKEKGTSAAANIGATFYEADVRDYASLSSAFDDTMKHHSRLDFVFANAGVTDPRNFYQTQSSTPPPEPSLSLLDINLKGAVMCAYLAQHYLRLSRQNSQLADSDPSLVFMSSIAGLETYSPIPLYTATKHGLVAFACAIATPFKESDGIRVSSICPGPVFTEKRKPSDAARADMVPMKTVCNAVDELIGPNGGFGRCLRVLSTGISDV